MWLQSLYEDMNSTQGVHVTCKAILRAEPLDGRVHALYGAKTGKNSNFSGCHFLWHTGRVRLDSQPLNISRHVVISIVKSFFSNRVRVFNQAPIRTPLSSSILPPPRDATNRTAAWFEQSSDWSEPWRGRSSAQHAIGGLCRRSRGPAAGL